MVLLVATTGANISLCSVNDSDNRDKYDIETLNLNNDADDASVPFLPRSSSAVTHSRVVTTTNVPDAATSSLVESFRRQKGCCRSNGCSGGNRLKVCVIGVICVIGSIITTFQEIDTVVPINEVNVRNNTKTKIQQQPQHHAVIDLFTNSNVKAAIPDIRYYKYRYPHPGQRSFPKWGNSNIEEQENGIFFPPLLHFIQTSSPYKGHPIYSQYYRATLDHSKESKTVLPKLPETVYIIQPSQAASLDNDLPPLLYSSNLHRWQHGPAVAIGNETLDRRHKVNITERIMLHALQTLHHVIMGHVHKRGRPRGQDDDDDDDDDICPHTPWPSLCHNLYPSLSKFENTTTSPTKHVAGGFPFLAWYGDYTGCNYHNWYVLVPNDTEPITPQKPVTNNHTQTNVSLPLFTVAAQSHCNFTIPFPNFYQISESMDHSAEWDMFMNQYRSDYPWSSKLSKIVWRGSLTGRIDNNITKCPRWTMVQSIHHIETQRRFALHQQLLLRRNVTNTTKMEAPVLVSDYHDMFDVKITYVPDGEKQYQSQLEHDIGDQPIVHSRLQFHEFQMYRGIIDIDGHSWSGRFGSLLCLNSIILKVDPQYIEYFYARKGYSRNNGNNDRELRAWEHYIPIRPDFSNLEEMAKYVLDPVNDDTLQGIVHNANDWCRQNMITSTIGNDMLDVWDRYVELLNINNNNWSEQYWTEDIQESIMNDIDLDMVLLNVSDYPSLRG